MVDIRCRNSQCFRRRRQVECDSAFCHARSVDGELVEEAHDLGALLHARAWRARSSQVTPQQVKRMAHSCGRTLDSIQDTTPLASLSGSGGAVIAARIGSITDEW